MKVIRKIAGLVRHQLAQHDKRRILSATPEEDGCVEQIHWQASLADPTGFYERCYRYFHRNLPVSYREHRAYFLKQRRGFGEDAFHVMWHALFHEFRFTSFLEIGVFRGQTLSLVSKLQQDAGMAGSVTGISPFESSGDSVSAYPGGIDYLQDTLQNVDAFGLPRPELFKAYSTDAEAVRLIRSRAWDCIYIDGNHDYEIAKADWQVCSESVRPGGLIVLDDSGLGTAFRPPRFSTGGHPGPSQVAKEIDTVRFREILQVGHNRVFQRVA